MLSQRASSGVSRKDIKIIPPIAEEGRIVPPGIRTAKAMKKRDLPGNVIGKYPGE
jgi:hypothetical protein